MSLPEGTCCQQGRAIIMSITGGRLAWRLNGGHRDILFCPWCGQGLPPAVRTDQEGLHKDDLGQPPMANARSPRVGQVFEHYKKKDRYECVGVGRLEATKDPHVAYLSYQNGELWLRPLGEFIGTVLDSQENIVPRYALADREPCPMDTVIASGDNQAVKDALVGMNRQCLLLVAENQALASSVKAMRAQIENLQDTLNQPDEQTHEPTTVTVMPEPTQPAATGADRSVQLSDSAGTVVQSNAESVAAPAEDVAKADSSPPAV